MPSCMVMNLLKELWSEEGEAIQFMVAKNPISHGRSKHIETRFYYLREHVSEGRLRLGYCKSEDQVVDLLTK